MNFQKLSEPQGRQGLPDFLNRRQKWKFGTAPHKPVQLARDGANIFGRVEIDAERFFGEEIFAGAEHIKVDLLVEMMRHGDINDVDVGTEQLMISAALPTPSELPVNPQPPDLLTLMNGDRVTSKADWQNKRAPELRTLVQHYEYGVLPPKPERMEAKLIREDKQALDGKATLREFDVRCTNPDARIHLMVVVPNARQKPAPCFLGLNFSGNYALLDDPKIQMPEGYVSDKYAGAPANRAGEAGRGKQADTWAIAQSIARGYAVASFYNGDVIPDQADLAKEALKKMVPAGKSADDPDAPATIGTWAWWCVQ